jgi:hypothetical protein
MQNQSAKFTFTVPEGHEQAGTKIEKSFDYEVCENDIEANALMTERGWSVLAFVNDAVKSNARSGAYQSALLPYKPSEVSPEKIRERALKDLVRLGMSEVDAAALISAGLTK